MDTYCPGHQKGAEMHVFILTLMRKHLDKVCKHIGTTKGPSCITSVLGRIFSMMEKGDENVLRPPNQAICSGDFHSGRNWVALAAFWEVSWQMQPTNDTPRAVMN